MWHRRPMTSATRSTRNVQTSRAAVVRTLTLERVRNYDLRSTGRYRPRKERGTVSAIASKQVPNTRNARIIRIMEIADSRSSQYERPAWGVPGTHVSGIGYNQYAHLGSKKAARPRVRPATTRAAARTPTTAKRDPPSESARRPDRRPQSAHRPTEAQSRPTQRSI